MANSSVWKNIKSVFVIEDESATKKDVKKSSAKKTTTPKTSPKSEPAISVPTGKINDKFLNVLFSAMEKANIEGFDYLEYKQSLKSLAKMPMDERTRFQSAYAMAQTMGASPQKLVETAGHYLDVLNQEEKKFEAALSKQMTRQIGNKNTQIEQLDAVVKNKAKQIKTLTEEIHKHQAEMEALRKEISAATVKVETTKNNFIASYQSLIEQIESDIANMKKYLK